MCKHFQLDMCAHCEQLVLPCVTRPSSKCARVSKLLSGPFVWIQPIGTTPHMFESTDMPVLPTYEFWILNDKFPLTEHVDYSDSRHYWTYTGYLPQSVTHRLSPHWLPLLICYTYVADQGNQCGLKYVLFTMFPIYVCLFLFLPEKIAKGWYKNNAKMNWNREKTQLMWCFAQAS